MVGLSGRFGAQPEAHVVLARAGDDAPSGQSSGKALPKEPSAIPPLYSATIPPQAASLTSRSSRGLGPLTRSL
jgi:hypothetical protein